jgi:O-antigen ligase
VVAALGLAAGLVRSREWKIPAAWFRSAPVAYFFVLLISVALAGFYSGAAIAAASLARVLLFGISLYLFTYVAYGPQDARDAFQALPRTLFFAGAASALFACVDFYFQFPAPAGFGAQFVWMASGVYRRAQGLFYEASTLGNLCAFFLLMAVLCLVQARRERGGCDIPRPALLAGAAIFVTALMLSFSRASIVNLLASLAALLWLKRETIGIRRLIAIPSFALAAGAAISYLALPRFADFYWLRLRVSVEYLASATGGVLSGRLESWAYLAEFLLQNPWHALAGVGYKTLPYSDFIGRPVIADNAYLSALVETGVVGLAALAWFSLWVLRTAFRASQDSNRLAAFCGAWMLCFWIGELLQMMSGDLLTYWRVLPVYFCVLGIAVRYSGTPDEHPVSRSVQ